MGKAAMRNFDCCVKYIFNIYQISNKFAIWECSSLTTSKNLIILCSLGISIYISTVLTYNIGNYFIAIHILLPLKLAANVTGTQ